MLPKVSPNSSLKNGPTTSRGSSGLMSPIFLRAWYHRSGISLERIESRATKITCDSPAREYERTNWYLPVSISCFSMRSVTCCATSSAVAPGHRVRTTMILNVNDGSSLRPSLRYAAAPAIASTSIA